MAKSSAGTAIRVPAGKRVVEENEGSYRVTIPERVCAEVRIAEGDDLRVIGTVGGGVGFLPAGVPFPPDTDLYAGNTSVVNHNGSLKAVIREEAARHAEITAGQSLSFSFRAGGGVVRCK